MIALMLMLFCGLHIVFKSIKLGIRYLGEGDLDKVGYSIFIGIWGVITANAALILLVYMICDGFAQG